MQVERKSVSLHCTPGVEYFSLESSAERVSHETAQHSNTMVIEPAFGTFGSVGRCQVLLENWISISIKLVSRRKHEVL